VSAGKPKDKPNWNGEGVRAVAQGGKAEDNCASWHGAWEGSGWWPEGVLPDLGGAFFVSSAARVPVAQYANVDVRTSTTLRTVCKAQLTEVASLCRLHFGLPGGLLRRETEGEPTYVYTSHSTQIVDASDYEWVPVQSGLVQKVGQSRLIHHWSMIPGAG